MLLSKANFRNFLLLMSLVGLQTIFYGQETKKDSVKPSVIDTKSFKMGALFVAEYRSSLTSDVGMDGVHNSEGVDSYDGTFLRYVRVSGNYKLDDKISASVLVNLADFKNSPQTRVLENAFIKYAYNDYLNLYVGQFRPFFGLEDLYPYEFGRSYVWSNQYEEFGRNGWQSFQLGLAVTGYLKKIGIPLNYYVSGVNGNGKNRTGDNDKSKDLTARVDYTFFKRFKLGVNGGFTDYKNQKANAYGADLEFEVPVADGWFFSMDAEYKNGTNFNLFTASEVPDKRLDDFRMAGIYTTPKIRYDLNWSRIKALEFSTRYEYFEQLTQNGNPRTTITPFFAMMLAEKYHAKVTLGVVFDRYQRQVDNSSQYNANFLFTQFQFKF